ncbi:MAG: NAD(P)H-dependent oxidoreductase [Rhizobiaceae bacterium]
MPKRILLIIGHPDSDPGRFCRALAKAYEAGARQGGHEVRVVDVAALEFPLLRSTSEFNAGSVPGGLKSASESILWAQHIVFIFPLWLGTMPALLKAFLEQVARPGIAFAYPDKGGNGFKAALHGRSARIIVTMGMPGFIYRLFYLGHGIAGMRRNILNFVGIKPVWETLFGMVESVSDAKRKSWIEDVRQLGAQGR